jgi:hypothetical protein
MHRGAAAPYHSGVSNTSAGICKTGLLFCCPNLSICLLNIISSYSACDTTVTAHSLTHSLMSLPPSHLYLRIIPIGVAIVIMYTSA